MLSTDPMPLERHLVSVPSLPEMSLRRPRRPNISSLGLARPGTLMLSMHPARKAREQHNKRREKEANHSRKHRPHSRGIVGMTVAPILIDMVLDNAEQREVASHNDDGGKSVV